MADRPSPEEPTPPAAAPDPAALGRWYVVQTNPRADKHARDRLLLDGFAVLWPHYPGTARHAGTEEPRMLSLFPGYLFVGVDARRDLWQVEHTVGVAAVVHRGPLPLEVPPRVIAAEMERCHASGLLRQPEMERLGLVPARRPWSPGQRVRFATGPLAGLVAVVDRLDKGDSLRVWVEMLGRTTATDAVDSDLASEVG